MAIDGEPDEFNALLEQRTPYGSHPDAPTAPLAPFSQASMDAAQNLLIKATSRLQTGEPEAAERLMTHAASLAYDEHERMWPGPTMAAHMLFAVLSEQSEFIADFEDGDLDYELGEESPLAVDLGIRIVRRELDELEAAALRRAVEDVTSDGDFYGIDREQARRMLDVVQAMPESEHARDLPADASESRRVEVIRACCRVAVLLVDAFDE